MMVIYIFNMIVHLMRTGDVLYMYAICLSWEQHTCASGDHVHAVVDIPLERPLRPVSHGTCSKNRAAVKTTRDTNAV